MEQIEFRKLNFPKSLNLDLLSGFLAELELKEIITDNCRKTRIQRRIQLPSIKLIKKVICHHLVKKYRGDYNKVMADLRGDFGFLKRIGIDRKQVRQLYEQREKEAKREK